MKEVSCKDIKEMMICFIAFVSVLWMIVIITAASVAQNSGAPFFESPAVLQEIWPCENVWQVTTTPPWNCSVSLSPNLDQSCEMMEKNATFCWASDVSRGCWIKVGDFCDAVEEQGTAFTVLWVIMMLLVCIMCININNCCGGKKSSHNERVPLIGNVL